MLGSLIRHYTLQTDFPTVLLEMTVVYARAADPDDQARRCKLVSCASSPNFTAVAGKRPLEG